MQIPLTCSLCGHPEWGRSDGILMNKIKMWNHAQRMHPQSIARVLEHSIPKESFDRILRSA